MADEQEQNEAAIAEAQAHLDNEQVEAQREADRQATEAATSTPAESSKPLTISLVAPWTLSAFVGTQADGGKLRVDRRGVKVDATDAALIITQAAKRGVTIQIGS